jgi:cobalt-zinc-cadmium efflux system membrane fusion protein
MKILAAFLSVIPSSVRAADVVQWARGAVILTRLRLFVVIGCAGVVVLGGLVVLRAPAVSAAKATQASALAATPPVPNAIEVPREALNNMNLHFARAELRPLMRTVRATGVVSFDARRFAQVSSPSRGRIDAIDVVAGQRVRAGQPLAILDAFDLSEVRSQVATAQAAVTDATETVSTAEKALTRATELVGIGGMAQSELERRRSMVANAKATLRSRQADLQKWLGMEQRLQPTEAIEKGNANVALGKLGPGDSLGAVVAPFDGIINSVGAAVGDIVDTSVRIFTVVDLSTVWVEASVPERELGFLKEGDAVTVTVEAYPGKQFDGRITYIASQADPNTGTVMVRCDLPNADGALRANMFATVKIAAPLGRNAVLVPDEALQDEGGQTVVFIPSGAGHFSKQAVRTGVSSGGFTEVVEGLKAETPVVTSGSYWLKADFLQNG